MSKKTKKAKEGKKVMTEEEKALYLQAQEEMDRKKEQTVIQFLKDKLEEDERSSVLWLQKLNEVWRILFRLCENEDQRSQIDVLKQTWERQLDDIDSCIQNMTEELWEKEQHSAQVHQCHLMHISQLNELQKKRMGLLQQEWESGMTRINKCYRLKREQMSLEDMFQSLNLEANVPDIQDQYEELLRDTKTTSSSLMDPNDRSFQEKRKAFLKQYAETVKERQLHLQTQILKLQVVTLKNQRYRDGLDRAIKELENDKKKFATLQSKHLSQEINETKVKAQLVDAEKQNKTLRAKVEWRRARSRKRLTELTIQSDKAARSLKSVIAQGEGVLRMAALCEKREDRLIMTEELQETVEENQDSDDSAEQEECDFPELSLLTRQGNMAIEQRNALQRLRDALRCQNKQLIMKHQKQDMQSSHHNMEIRGGTGCRPNNTPASTPFNSARSSAGQGNHAAALGSPGHVSNKLETPFSMCLELSASPTPTLQGTAYPHLYHRM